MNKINIESKNVKTANGKEVGSSDWLAVIALLIMFWSLLIFDEPEKRNDKCTNSSIGNDNVKPVFTPK